MPELPEVESIRRGLEKVLIEQKILSVEVISGKIVSSNSNIRIVDKEKVKEFKKGLLNKKITHLKRRAKNIIIELEDKSIILIHLKMTGQLVYEPKDSQIKNKDTIKSVKIKQNKEANIIAGGHPIDVSYTNPLPNKHTHIIIKLESGTLFYNDVRKFGYVLYYQNQLEAINNGHFVDLGAEPLDSDFSIDYFKKRIISKNKSIKSSLLSQEIVVGVGNIYADEVCFASKINPNRNCQSLTDSEVENLYTNIKKILRDAIQQGGSSISDYLLSDGSRGNYARSHKVYGKAGEPCYICNTPLSKTLISTRTTVYCDRCQK